MGCRIVPQARIYEGEELLWLVQFEDRMLVLWEMTNDFKLCKEQLLV